MLVNPSNSGMWELRFFWNKWRLSYDWICSVDSDGEETGFDIHVVYFGPFCIARHVIPLDHR